MRKYHGYELSEDCQKIVGISDFIIFGSMSDGMKCYYKIVDGVVCEDKWYSCCYKNVMGRRFRIFIVEGC